MKILAERAKRRIKSQKYQQGLVLRLNVVHLVQPNAPKRLPEADRKEVSRLCLKVFHVLYKYLKTLYEKTVTHKVFEIAYIVLFE